MFCLVPYGLMLAIVLVLAVKCWAGPVPRAWFAADLFELAADAHSATNADWGRDIRLGVKAR